MINEESWKAYPLLTQTKNIVNSNTDKNTFILNGYFQSYNSWINNILEIKDLFIPQGGIVYYLKQHSNVFDLFPELEIENDFCFIGVRRGDYITYANHNMNMRIFFSQMYISFYTLCKTIRYGI